MRKVLSLFSLILFLSEGSLALSQDSNSASPQLDQSYVKSLQLIKLFLHQYPQSKELKMVLARVHFRAGKFQQALLAFQEALKQFPHFQDLHLGKAASLNQLLKYNEAIEAYKKIRGYKDPRSYLAASIGLAEVFHATGAYTEEIAVLRELLQKKKTDLSLRYKLAQALELSSRNPSSAASKEKYLQEAMSHYDFVLSKKSDHVDALYSRGRLLIRRGARNKGRKDLELFRQFKKSLRILSEETLTQEIQQYDVTSYRELAEALNSLGDTKAALNQIEEGLKVGVDQATLFVLKGNLLLTQKMPGKAIASFLSALAKSSNHQKALWGLGHAYFRMNDKAKAQTTFIQLLKLNPNHSDRVEQLARMAVEGQLFEKNAGEFTFAALKLRKSPQNYLLRAQWFAKAGKIQDALSTLELGLRDFPQNQDLQAYLKSVRGSN